MDRYSKLLRVVFLYLGLFFPLAGGLSAQSGAEVLQFGYADRSAGNVSIVAEKTAFYSVGMVLPKMKGNVIKGLSLYLAGAEGEQGDEHSVFIASAADNKVKYIQPVSLHAGWNDVMLSRPFLMEGDAYYVGYQLQVRAGKKPIAFEQPSGGKLSGVDFLEEGGVYQSEGDPVELAPIEVDGLGNVLIFAHIEDRINRLTNIGSVVSGGFTVEELTSGGEHTLTLKVRNLGSRPINSLDVTTQFGAQAERVIALSNLNIPAQKSQDVTLKVTAPSRGIGVFYAAVTKVNGTPNLFAEIKHEMPYKVKTANASWPRKTMLIERFTTERCVNCPGSEPYFKSLVQQMEGDGMEVSVIAHHAGYYTDAFTVPGSISLVRYSYASGEFAPALMVNRLPDSKRSGFLAGTYDNRADKYAKAKAVNEVLSFTQVKATEQAGSLTLHIEGEVGLIDQENLFLTAVITEDHVRAVNQAGADGVFYHDHLARKFLTSEYGTPIQLKPDATFSLEIKNVAIDPLWKKENLRVVVLAHKNIRAADHTQREVYSSKSVRWAALTALDEVATQVQPRVSVRNGYLMVDADIDQIAVFDMAGRLISKSYANRLESGVYVVRLGVGSRSTTHKVLVD